jgi:phosphate starvation-inducible protein PhoH
VIDQPHLGGAADLETWLRRLTEYWRQHLRVRQDAPEDLAREVRDLLRPEFERVPSLAYRVDSVVTAMDRLTDDQYRQLDLIEENPRIMIDGGAGSGKTFLAMEIARRGRARGEPETYHSCAAGRPRSASMRRAEARPATASSARA